MKCERCGREFPHRGGRFCGSCIEFPRGSGYYLPVGEVQKILAADHAECPSPHPFEDWERCPACRRRIAKGKKTPFWLAKVDVPGGYAVLYRAKDGLCYWATGPFRGRCTRRRRLAVPLVVDDIVEDYDGVRWRVTTTLLHRLESIEARP